MNLNLRLWENPWRLMLAVNAAVLIGVFWHKITLPPYVPYIHLLVDYHFGFTKRALIGAIVSLFTAKVPVWLVFALAGTVWLVTAGLFVQLFRRTFGFDREASAAVRVHGGLAVLPEEFHAHARAFRHLRMPVCDLPAADSRALACLCVACRDVLDRARSDPPHSSPDVCADDRRHRGAAPLSRSRIDRQNVAVGIASLGAVGVLFIAAQFYGTVPVPETEFVAHLHSRMADPSQTNLLSFGYIWYQPLSKEIWDTWARLPHNLLGVPVFALLIWLHTPLWRYFRDLVAALSVDAHRRIVTAAIIMVSLGYLVMFAIVFDYSRWISNWAVCLFLILHAVKALPASKDTPPISADDRKTTVFGWIVTLIPRVGIVRPF